MTFTKTNGLAAATGTVLGILFFTLAYLFRDAFSAAVDLGSPTISGRAMQIMVVPGIAAGIGLVAMAEQFVEECGAVLLIPLLVVAVAAGGTGLLLVHQFAQSSSEVLNGPVLVGAVVTAIVAIVRGWMRA